MIDLKATFGRTYRITLDESAEIQGQTREDRLWLYQIPGKHGHVYVHGNGTLGAYVRTYRDKSDRLGRLLAIPGAKIHQQGDTEATVTFPVGSLDAVAAILTLRRRRQLTDEARRRLAAMGKRFVARDTTMGVSPTP